MKSNFTFNLIAVLIICTIIALFCIPTFIMLLIAKLANGTINGNPLSWLDTFIPLIAFAILSLFIMINAYIINKLDD